MMKEKTIVDVTLEWVKRQNTKPIDMCLPIRVIELIDREGCYVLIRNLSRWTGNTEGFTLYQLREDDTLIYIHGWRATDIKLAFVAFAAFVFEDPDLFYLNVRLYQIDYDDDFKEVIK